MSRRAGRAYSYVDVPARASALTGRDERRTPWVRYWGSISVRPTRPLPFSRAGSRRSSSMRRVTAPLRASSRSVPRESASSASPPRTRRSRIPRTPSRQHQAFRRPQVRRDRVGAQDRRLRCREGQGRSRRRQDRGQAVHARGDLGDGAPEDEGRRRGVSRRDGHRGRHHGPGLLQRHAAPGDQGRGQDRGPRRQAHHQRAHGGSAGLRPRQGRRETRRSSSSTSAAARSTCPSSSSATACSRSSPPVATTTWVATTGISGSSTGWPTSSRPTRASTCARTRWPCSASRTPPRRPRSSCPRRRALRSTCRS